MKNSLSGFSNGPGVVPDFPDLIATCPVCGGDVALWSEEIETRCSTCDRTLYGALHMTH